MGDRLISCELLGQLPKLAAERWGERIALIFKDRSWSYQEFDHEVNVVARALTRRGIRPGDKVAVWLPNCPEIQFILFAIARIGAIAVPLNARYRSIELSYALKFSGSSLLIASARTTPVDFADILAKALEPVHKSETGNVTFASFPQLRSVVTIGDATVAGATSWESFRASGLQDDAALKVPPIHPSDAVMMMFTSGTTGNPKAVLLNHAGLRMCRDRARMMEFTPDDVQLTYLPLFHIYSIGYSVIMSFMSGATQVLMEVFQADEALRLIQQHRVTVVHGFDAHFSALLAAQTRAQLDISSLRTGSFATGAESTRALAEEVQDRFCSTAASYGLTETWGGFTISPPNATRSQRCEASGLAQEGIEVRIVDPETGHVLPPETIGEIQVRSYALFMAYYNDPQATAAAVDEEGWFRTGDAGLLRSDGHLRWVARYKDMLKVGGENVAPAEVENLLCQIPGVESVAVVGRKDSRLQEVPVAFVVRSGQSAPNENDIVDFCRGKIATFKIPKHVIFVDEMPMTSTGKIQKEVLRKRLQSETDAGGAQPS